MGMDFGDGPDFDAIKEERAKAKNGEEKKAELKEEDCWEYIFHLQKYKPTKKDDGLRQIFRNTLTGRHRMKKVVGKKQYDTMNNTPFIDKWDWDGDPYEV